MVLESQQRRELVGVEFQAAYLQAHPAWLARDPDAASTARQHLRDFTPAAPTTPSVIGFLWNDFTVFRDEPAFAFNPDRAFVYGQPAVECLLRNASTGGARVRAVSARGSRDWSLRHRETSPNRRETAPHCRQTTPRSRETSQECRQTSRDHRERSPAWRERSLESSVA